jgi:hypothetical protein
MSEPAGYAVVMADGHFVGIWRDREIAEKVCARQPRAHGDCVIPLYNINVPEFEDFVKGVCLEAEHQVARWGDAHDRSKSAENWYWLVGYLAGKALRAAITGDREKALHHCISAAAALLNWHSAIKRDTSGAGVGQDEDLAS